MPFKKLTDGPADELDPIWSPDGSWIVYGSDSGDDHKYDIYLISASGGTPLLLYALDESDIWPTSWTGR